MPRRVSKYQPLPYPVPTSPAATKTMRANRPTNTKVERSVRTLVHARGMRYRINLAISPDENTKARPDLVFARLRIAVFLDGCFWHSCPLHGREPKTNQGYWLPKLQRNATRDRLIDGSLARAGWEVLRIWEHVEPIEAAGLIEETVRRKQMKPT